MAKQLTDRTLRTARAGAELADGAVRGLRFTVSPKGLRTFLYRYRSPGDGSLRQVTLGHYGNGGDMTLEQARSRCLELRQVRRGGVDPRDHLRHQQEQEAAELGAAIRAKEATDYTVERLCTDYLRAHSGWRPSTEREIGRLVNTLILPRWRNVPAAQLTRRDISDALDAIHGKTPTLSNRFLWLVKAVLDFAVEKEHIPGNPAAGIKRRHRERPKERRLDDVELKRLLAWLNGKAAEKADGKAILSTPLRDLVRFLLLTGCCLGEAAGASAEEFDFEAASRWAIPASRTKNKRDHIVHLSAQAQAIIKPRLPEKGYLWPARRGKGHLRVDSVGSALRKAQAHGLKLRPFSAHDIRRSVASGMGDLGIAREVIARCLGHSPAGVTERHYDHARRDREAARAWQQWADRLDTLTQRDVLPMGKRHG
jgi:integrase